jgi:hypothetical protein
MSRKGADYAIIATGVGLWYVGAKTIADYHENVSAGVHDDFQHRHATAIGGALTLSGLGLAVWGTYRLNPTWGKYVGGGLGALLVFNAVRRKAGEPLFSLAPFPMPKRHLAGWS